MDRLPTFKLEAYFGRWEFKARYHLTASDAETMSVSELLAMGTPDDRDAFERLGLGYIPTEGTLELRDAIATTYNDEIDLDDVLCFAGAEEALFWTLRLLLSPGDHAIVGVPNYQSSESLPLATGADVSALPLWKGGDGDLRWTLNLDRLRSLLRPNTKVVAVNFPNNPTGFVPDRETFTELVRLCDQRGIRLVSDEVFRGVELDPSRTLPQAAELSERAVSINVVSKAYGLPGLRVGWVACRDHELLDRLLQAKFYTSICNAGPSEFLATIALRNADRIRERTRTLIAANCHLFDEFFAEHADRFDWQRPDGGCVAFPRYLGSDGVEHFCTELVERQGVLLLPGSMYESELTEIPPGRFRIGVGRRDPKPALDAMRAFLDER
ncbi:PLP-dependent aminotransferase family protein [Flindersiella endophytica]